MIVVETSAFVAHLRGRRQVTNAIRRHAGAGPVLMPTLVMWELWKGAATPRQREGVTRLIATVTPDALVPGMAQIAADLQRSFFAKGRAKPAFDLLIASHALHNGVPLLAGDKDYEDIPGIDLIRVRSH